MEELQKLRYEVIALRSGVRVEGVGAQLGVGTRAPGILASDTEDQGVNLGYRLTVLRALAAGMRELGEAGRIGGAGTGVNDGANPLLYR